MRTTRILIATAIALFLLPRAQAQPTHELETYRAELLAYVSAMQSLPKPALAQVHASETVLADAEARIRQLSAAELGALKAQTDQVPYWREVPESTNGATRPEQAQRA